MKNMTIATRLMLMIGTALLSLVLIGFVGLSVAGKETESLKQITDGNMEKIEILGKARQVYMETRVAILARFVSPSNAEMESLEKVLKTNEEDILNHLKSYENLVSGEEDRKMLEEDRSTIINYFKYMNTQLLPPMKRFEIESAAQLVGTSAGPIGIRTMKSLNDHMTFNTKQAELITRDALVSADQGKMYSFIVILAAFVVIGLLGFVLIGNIKSSLKQIQMMVDRVESNLDFTVRVSVSNNDEIGHVTSALNRLLDKLQGNLKSIANGANAVASAANLMATTSSHVATASHEQSESASGMAATVEEMTVSINHVADRALETSRISTESGQLALSGEHVIGQTVSDIQDIAQTVHDSADLIHSLEQHSQQISNVVRVIKEVAEQTNLLALNAAIEAARAGEQGRGFAVVADEVRKLAERTSASTQEISSTIDTMRTSASNAVVSMEGAVDKVTKGVQRAQEANESIKQIGEGSRNAVEMVEEIAIAIREQGSATNNIASQVERIAQMSEESSAAAGNSAQTAHDLNRLAAEMQQIVSAYKL